MRINDPFINPFFKHTVNFFGGGGSTPPPPAPVKIPDAPITPNQIPKAPAPLPPPPPPASKSGIDQQGAADQARMDAARRRGYAKSLIAGETGGANKNGSLLG